MVFGALWRWAGDRLGMRVMPEASDGDRVISRGLQLECERAFRAVCLVDAALFVFDGKRHGAALSVRSLAEGRFKKLAAAAPLRTMPGDERR